LEKRGLVIKQDKILEVRHPTVYHTTCSFFV